MAPTNRMARPRRRLNPRRFGSLSNRISRSQSLKDRSQTHFPAHTAMPSGSITTPEPGSCGPALAGRRNGPGVPSAGLMSWPASERTTAEATRPSCRPAGPHSLQAWSASRSQTPRSP